MFPFACLIAGIGVAMSKHSVLLCHVLILLAVAMIAVGYN